jgi:predicted unusual protein kinase regulating ubiquinone biosynthesis (AarF/ABC1/UbiB family)
VRLVLRGMAAGLCYADAHAGNFLFRDDGRLGVVDFGACRILAPAEIAFVDELESAIFGGVGDLRRAARVLAGGEPRSAGHQEFLERYLEWLWTPLRVDGPFDFSSPEHFRRGLELARAGVRHRHLRFHPGASWFARAIFGVRSLAHQLGARIDLRRIEREEWGRRRGGAG